MIPDHPAFPIISTHNALPPPKLQRFDYRRGYVLRPFNLDGPCHVNRYPPAASPEPVEGLPPTWRGELTGWLLLLVAAAEFWALSAMMPC
jgi:hypothetical protein